MPATAFGGDGVMLAAVGWTGVFLSVIAIFLRAHAASRLNGKWRWDFIWVVLTAIVGLAAWIICFTGTLYGLGNDISELSLPQAFLVLKHVWLTIYVGLVAVTFAKFSVVALLFQVQGYATQKRNIALWVVAVSFTMVNTVQLFLAIFQCEPVHRLWHPDLPGVCKGGHVGRLFNYFQGAYGAFTDLILALWPISIAWNLKLNMRTKVGICVLLSLGIFPAIASAMRCVSVPKTYEVNPTKQAATFMMWCIVEAWTIIVLTSIPVLRHFFMRVVFGAVDSAATDSEPGLNRYVHTSGVHGAVMNDGQPFALRDGNNHDPMDDLHLRDSITAEKIAGRSTHGSKEDSKGDIDLAGVYIVQGYNVTETGDIRNVHVPTSRQNKLEDV